MNSFWILTLKVALVFFGILLLLLIGSEIGFVTGSMFDTSFGNWLYVLFFPVVFVVIGGAFGGVIGGIISFAIVTFALSGIITFFKWITTKDKVESDSH
jgi:hypothetical protein